jgi:hypothetical protein
MPIVHLQIVVGPPSLNQISRENHQIELSLGRADFVQGPKKRIQHNFPIGALAEMKVRDMQYPEV